MPAKIHFTGPAQYRIRNALELSWAIAEVCARRILRGPRRKGWNWFVEVATRMLRRELIAAFKLRDVNEMRGYLDSLVITSPILSEVTITPVSQGKYRGTWFIPKNAGRHLTVLYFHGGGYSFYPKSYASFIAHIAVAAKSRTFVVDYRLSPENQFPAQLEDSLGAYRWILENHAHNNDLIVAGDSAGGNLTLALLLAARDSKLPPPGLAIALSPAVEFENDCASIVRNADFDWIDKRMLLQWADWYCPPAHRRDPLVSLLGADLRGLPPIYMQAGRAEILFDSIQAFADRAKAQGADVVLETWEDMNHVFQLFGYDAPQSAGALRRIGEVIDARLRRAHKTEAVSAIET
jgi:epsilon-lactone hydrolase